MKIILSIILFYILGTGASTLYYGQFHPLLFFYALMEFPNTPVIIMLSFLSGIFIILISLKQSFSGVNRKGKYGYAGFAKSSDVSMFGLNFKSGIILGKAFGKYIKLDKPLSVLVLAPPGTGKTSGIIIPTLLTLRNSVIVHDPKGELYKVTVETRKKFSKILLFDPLGEKSCIFNPFSKNILPSNKDTIHTYLSNISNLLLKTPDTNSRDHFTLAARKIFVFVSEWLIWKKGETSFPEIREFLLNSPKPELQVVDMIKDNGVPEKLVQDGNSILSSLASPKQWAGEIKTFYDSMEVFRNIQIEKATRGENEIFIDRFRKEDISFYLSIRENDRETLSFLVSILIESLGKQLISKEPEKDDKKITFILDEFVRLGKIDIIKELPSIARGFKVNTVFVAQDYEQISSLYDSKTVPTFDTNCAYKVVFQQNNLQTAEKISKLIGNKTERRRSQSKSRNSKLLDSNASMGESDSVSDEGVALVTSQDILSMKQDTCLILSQGYLAFPIKAKIAYYFDKKNDFINQKEGKP